MPRWLHYRPLHTDKRLRQYNHFRFTDESKTVISMKLPFTSHEAIIDAFNLPAIKNKLWRLILTRFSGHVEVVTLQLGKPKFLHRVLYEHALRLQREANNPNLWYKKPRKQPILF